MHSGDEDEGQGKVNIKKENYADIKLR